MPDPAKLTYLLRLPWTFVREQTPEGDTVLRVAEVPSAVGTGDTDVELEADVWASLRASLESYLQFGDTIPLPVGSRLTWESSFAPTPTPPVFLVRKQLRATKLSGSRDPKGTLASSR